MPTARKATARIIIRHNQSKNDKSDPPSGRHFNKGSHKAQKQACHGRRAADQILSP